MSRSARNNGWCRHRTPFDKKTHPVCDIGIDYHEFLKPPPEGWSPQNTAFDNMPCLGAKTERCPQFAEWSPEEVAAQEAEMTARFKRIGVIRTAIIATTGPKGTGSGRIDPCPACSKGIVSWSRASNGHVHARCSTPDCASWME